jgi:hypothetical protein
MISQSGPGNNGENLNMPGFFLFMGMEVLLLKARWKWLKILAYQNSLDTQFPFLYIQSAAKRVLIRVV